MKKISAALLLLFAFFAVSGVSAERDDDRAARALIGKWKVVSMTRNGETRPLPPDASMFMEFKKDGLGVAHITTQGEKSEKENFEWEVEDNLLFIIDEDDNPKDKGESGPDMKKDSEDDEDEDDKDGEELGLVIFDNNNKMILAKTSMNSILLHRQK